jgi:hypothetical protein
VAPLLPGDARVVKDDAVHRSIIATSNLVFWGDPSEQQAPGRRRREAADQVDAEGDHRGAQKYPADSHVPVLIYPNPLNPKRYVVLNSGFTFQDQAPMSNSRHVPMLPDWASWTCRRRRSRGRLLRGKWELK